MRFGCRSTGGVVEPCLRRVESGGERSLDATRTSLSPASALGQRELDNSQSARKLDFRLDGPALNLVPPLTLRLAMPSSHKDARHAALYKPLKKRMIENGDWDRCISSIAFQKQRGSLGLLRISARLARELNESGWIDRFKDRSKGMRYLERASIVRHSLLCISEIARNGGISVEALMTELLPLAEGLNLPILSFEGD